MTKSLLYRGWGTTHDAAFTCIVIFFNSGLLKYGNSVYPLEDTTKLEILQASLLYRPTAVYTILILFINLNQAKHYIDPYRNITLMPY